MLTSSIQTTLPLVAWRGEKATYHLVEFEGEAAEKIATHAALYRMEFGKRRGFGSVKVIARVGDTEWKTSVFPMNVESAGGFERADKHWTLLVSKKVMRAEDLAEGDLVPLILNLL